jgi:hypothetical protein
VVATPVAPFFHCRHQRMQVSTLQTKHGWAGDLRGQTSPIPWRCGWPHVHLQPRIRLQ